MVYCKSSQPIPGKGDAWTYYECADDNTILRYVTYISQTNETERVTDPIVKKLYRPDLVQESSKDEFDRHWDRE
ncbi:MAG TPA: hypothetical protein HPP77_09905 [Candidatus Hydrogenedentes bacterium]|nr:hypothetical protein [Candidatus Hydrogenedentota bacterium]HIJ73237.1 hypothetical protein [Candidatus Hydrogenedentota bacterium]